MVIERNSSTFSQLLLPLNPGRHAVQSDSHLGPSQKSVPSIIPLPQIAAAVGAIVGEDVVGAAVVGPIDGFSEGWGVVGAIVGPIEGFGEGKGVGESVGLELGFDDGNLVGRLLGLELGLDEGSLVGLALGSELGMVDGSIDVCVVVGNHVDGCKDEVGTEVATDG